jgi:formamidopyrimidine-DNA glycosylase
MPELPEVETIVREMREASIIGTTIEDAIVYWERTIGTSLAIEFIRKIKKQKIVSINRRAKFLVIKLSNDTLLIHLRMTGKIIIADSALETSSHERVRLFLSNGKCLIYEDQRKFGRMYLLNEPQDKLKHLGLEPLSDQFTKEAFNKVLKRSNRKIKSFLLDQTVISGLGNIYVDEALWEATIHPLRLTKSLSSQEVLKLFKAIPNVLLIGIENQGTSLGDKRSNYQNLSGKRGKNIHQLQVFRREGKPCPRCGQKIVKLRVAQRGTHICPNCQVLT